jgi:hypothetical protein
MWELRMNPPIFRTFLRLPNLQMGKDVRHDIPDCERTYVRVCVPVTRTRYCMRVRYDATIRPVNRNRSARAILSRMKKRLLRFASLRFASSLSLSQGPYFQQSPSTCSKMKRQSIRWWIPSKSPLPTLLSMSSTKITILFYHCSRYMMMLHLFYWYQELVERCPSIICYLQNCHGCLIWKDRILGFDLV